MAIENVGVRLVAENEAQFKRALSSADQQVKNFGKGIDKSTTAATSKWQQFTSKLTSPTGIKAMAGVLGLVGSAVYSVGKSAMAAANQWAAYNEQVRQISIATSTAPEDLSRLMQAADDVGVSMGSMQTALIWASKHGIQPTIENIAKLSDEMLAIEDPAARSAALSKMFGRNWASIAPFILSGSDAIKKGTAAIDSNMVATEKSIKESRRYMQAIDDLSDKWTGFRNQAGAIVLPVITEGLEEASKGLDHLISASQEYSAWADTANRAMEKNLVTRMEMANIEEQVRNKTLSYADATKMLTSRIEASISPQERMEMASRAAGAAAYEFAYKSRDVGAALDEEGNAIEPVITAVASYNDQLLATGRNAISASDKVKELAAQNRNIEFQASLSFQFPNIAEQMANMIKSDKWKAAGGEALTAWMEQAPDKMQPLSDAQREEIGKKVGAVDIALEIKTGDITMAEGIQQFRDTFQGVNWDEAKASIEGALQVEPADLSTYLTQITGIATATTPASTETEALTEKVEAVGAAMGKNSGALTGWVDNTGLLGEKSHETAMAVGELNTQIKNIPPVVTVDVYFRSHGAPGTYTTAQEEAMCFIAGTPISIEGGTKPIEKIQVGDLVWSYDETELKPVLRSVTKTTTGKRRHVVIFNTSRGGVICSDNHRFYNGADWIEARNLLRGDQVLTFEMIPATVIEIEYLPDAHQVYNFEVDETHNYFANGLLVHNGKASGGPVAGNTVYLVGERGPELFVPQTSGRIIPNTQTQRIIDSVYSVIPMAKGGKVEKSKPKVTPEKAHMKALREKWRKRHFNPDQDWNGGGGEGGEVEGAIGINDYTLRLLETASTNAWDVLKQNVAEYNYMVKRGVAPSLLTKQREQIATLARQAEAITALKIATQKQVEAQKAGDELAETLPVGLGQSTAWMQALIEKFKTLFSLLTGSAASSAMSAIAPLISSSPAPLAVGLEQIKRQMDKLSTGALPRFTGSVSQLASPSQIMNSRTVNNNLSIPISATVSNQADIRILAYAVAKEIAANVRA